MIRKKLVKQLWVGLLLTFLISSCLTLLVVNVAFSKSMTGNEGKQAILIVSIIAVIFIFILTLLSATLFLNLIPGVRNNFLLSFLTYYLLPLSAALIVGFDDDFIDMWVVFLTISVSFFAVHTYFFVRFRKVAFTADATGSDQVKLAN